MARARYSVKESINRILRLLEGKGASSDQPETLTPNVLSEDEAWSDIAELLADSLPNESLEVPASFVATVSEVNEGSVDNKVLTPYGHTISHEFGGIYASGTFRGSQAFPVDVWTKITGAFTNFTLDSGGEILCDWNDDRLVLNEVGNWFIYYNLSLYADFAEEDYSSLVEFAIFSSGTIQPQTHMVTVIYTQGFRSVLGIGPINVPTIGWPVDIRVKSGSTGTSFTVLSGQLYARKEVGSTS